RCTRGALCRRRRARRRASSTGRAGSRARRESDRSSQSRRGTAARPRRGRRAAAGGRPPSWGHRTLAAKRKAAEIEDTRALIHSGWPDALTVDPEDLAALRHQDRLEMVGKLGAAAAVVIGLLSLAVLGFRLMIPAQAQTPYAFTEPRPHAGWLQ